MLLLIISTGKHTTTANTHIVGTDLVNKYLYLLADVFFLLY